ncbi:MAG: prepilin-type N-terminal cleavage/methylation domain-containing protein [Candidatus Levybacteria bacterium]|nr:prepilin-type N-terminal cleavage/methylation domain-containing protein [Candidatus Levybacteria bacterium]
MKLFRNNQKGFTLIELLVVIGILAILLAITLIAINPARQFAQANNTQRQSDVNAILNAVHQYMADNNGTPPAGIPVDDGDPATDDTLPIGVNAALPASVVDLCTPLAPTYIAAIPTDPQSGVTPVTDCAVDHDTDYRIVQSATNSRITISAPDAELTAIISVTR